MVRKLLAAAPGSSPGRRSWEAAKRGRRKEEGAEGRDGGWGEAEWQDRKSVV